MKPSLQRGISLAKYFRGPCQLKHRFYPKYFLQNSNNKQAFQQRVQGPWPKQTIPNKTIPSSVLPKPDQVCPAKSTLLREERDAGCTAAGARGLKPLRAKRPALRRIGSTDDGPRLMLKLENKSGQSCGGWRGRCERQEISEFYLFATKSRTDLPCHSGLTSSPTNGQRSPGQNIVPLTM